MLRSPICVCALVALAFTTNTVNAQSPKESNETSKPAYTAFPDLKPPALGFFGSKKAREQYQQELNDLIYKDVIPEEPKSPTPLQKVKFAQLQEGLMYLQHTRELINIGRWDPNMYTDQLAMAAQTHLIAAELHTTPEGELRCYEARVILLKDVEQFIGLRVEIDGGVPLDLNLVRFRRLAAEADLLKLKESLKDKE